MWWYTPITPVLKRQTHEDRCKVEVSLVYTVSDRLARANSNTLSLEKQTDKQANPSKLMGEICNKGYNR